MLVVISPAKRLDFDPPGTVPGSVPDKSLTQPDFLADAQSLVDTLSDYTPRRLTNLMGISKSLAELNAARYSEFQQPFTRANAKPAILAFKGDVYLGLQAETLKNADLAWAQQHLRILSGLYGVLRPLDLMQAYRLEMGTRLKTPRGKDLYDWWGEQVTHSLNATLDAQPKSSRRDGNVLINLASNEYFGAVREDSLNGQVLNVTFKDLNKGKYKVLSFFAKKARGYMTNYIITQRCKTIADLKNFAVEGYAYCEDSSSNNELVFLRDTQQA